MRHVENMDSAADGGNAVSAQGGDGTATVLHIRNMVCPRCVMAVRDLLASEGFAGADVELGSAAVHAPVTPEAEERIRRGLEALGFELLDDPRDRLVERIRIAVTELARGGRLATNLSEHLSRLLGHDYSRLSKLFSSSQGYTVERYFIAQKVERAKELLLDGEMSLGEIADALGYSSAAHLSAQFKSVTGETPTRFRSGGAARRTPLDAVCADGGK